MNTFQVSHSYGLFLGSAHCFINTMSLMVSAILSSVYRALNTLGSIPRIVLFMGFFTLGVWGQSTGDFRSAQSGNWNQTSTWERFDGSNWVNASAFPTASTAGVILIRQDHTVTKAGGATSGSNTTIPNGIIQVGQGFIVKITLNSVLFNNTMRLGNNDNQFLRIAEAEQNRVRVAISGPNSFYQDILVNYMTGATNEFDPGIDGKYINDSDTAFYTLLNHESYVIQGRSVFTF